MNYFGQKKQCSNTKPKTIDEEHDTEREREKAARIEVNGKESVQTFILRLLNNWRYWKFMKCLNNLLDCRYIISSLGSSSQFFLPFVALTFSSPNNVL